jgi:hypothetical protein
VKHIKACKGCDVSLVKGTEKKGYNWYASNSENRMYICNKCFKLNKNKLKTKQRKEKQVGDARHLNDMREGARNRARKSNVPYNLTVKDLREIITDKCPILGTKFELNKVGQAWGKGKDKNNWQTSPSLDRIVPEKGYVKDNIIIVSLMANSIKNQATPDQIQKVATFYKKLYTEKGLTYVN